MSLQQSLSELGIRPSSAAPPPATLADIIEELLFELYPFILDHRIEPLGPSVTGLVDLHADLSFLMLRVEATLARHGHAIVRKIRSPEIEVEHGGLVADGVAKTYKTECQHTLVDVDEKRAHIICRTCNTPLNPMWWIAKFTKEVGAAGEARHHLRKENMKLRDENELLRKERSSHRAAVKRTIKKAPKKS